VSRLIKASAIVNVDGLSLGGDPVFLKLVPVRARQMQFAFSVSHPEAPGGILCGNPGDWLVQGQSGAKWVCSDKVFREVYRKASEMEFVGVTDSKPEPPAPQLPDPDVKQ